MMKVRLYGYDCDHCGDLRGGGDCSADYLDSVLCS